MSGMALSVETRQLDVEVSYPGTAVNYYLYKNNLPDPVCTIDPFVAQAQCIVELDDAPMLFTLTAVDAAGRQSPKSPPYILCPPPKANFTASVTSGAAPLLIQFDASSSSDSCGVVDRWTWNFGDGAVGTGEFIDHIFAATGNPIVTLTVANDAGVFSSAKTSAITVTNPTQSFTYTWDYATSAPGVTGFRLYKNKEVLCETSNPLVRTLTCQFPKTSGVQSFYLTALGANNTESGPSNTITFDPNPTGAPPASNSAPTATDQTLTLLEDTPTNGTLTATDPDNDPLTFTIITPPTRGVAALTNSGVGTFTYTPATNSNGADRFVYRVGDGKLTADATVAVTIAPVNDAPIAAGISLAATEDITASGQLLGSDVDGDALTYSIVTNGAKGAAAITNASTGAFTYTPQANKNGIDTIVYRVSDGKLTSDATVTVTIAPVNDAPIAAAVSLSATEDVMASGQLLGSDVDGDALTYSIVTNGANGAAAITNAATGAFTYMPQANKTGTDTIIYRVSDGKVTSDATVTVMVTIATGNNAPIAAGISLSATEDVMASGQLLGSDVDGDALTYTIVTNGAKGTAVITNASTGAFTYTPQANKNGIDTIIYRVSDGKLTSDATVTVTIAPVNDGPNAAAVSLSATEDVMASGQLLGSDVDGDALTYSIVSNGSKGTAAITNTSTGAFTYTPAANNNGSDSFVYRVSDGVLTADATVTVTIAPVNDAPVAVKDVAEVVRGMSVSIPVLANDTDVDGDPLSLVSVFNTPPFITVSIVNDKIVCTAGPSFVGKISFSYTIQDGSGGTATGVVDFTVKP